MQIHNILPETQQYLGGSLPQNSAVEIRLIRKEFGEVPIIGDRVSNEDHSVWVRRQLAIRLSVSGEVRKFVHIDDGDANRDAEHCQKSDQDRRDQFSQG